MKIRILNEAARGEVWDKDTILGWVYEDGSPYYDCDKDEFEQVCKCYAKTKSLLETALYAIGLHYSFEKI